MAKTEAHYRAGFALLPLLGNGDGVSQQTLLNPRRCVITNRCGQAALTASRTGLTSQNNQREAQLRLGDWGSSAGFTSRV